MKSVRLLLGGAVFAFLAGAAFLAQSTTTSADKMSESADKFLATLSPELKAKATFTFEDQERTNWNFVPLQDKDKKPTRKGLRLEEMSKEQQAAALELVRAGTSAVGYTKATTVMSLEGILRDVEKNGAMVRNPNWYFFSVFGKPSKTGKWGWRVEGHHLSLNFTLGEGKVVSATPTFFGANPAVVKEGKQKDLRTLPEAEDPARALYTSLTDAQKKQATRAKAHEEIEQKKTAPALGKPEGVPVADFTPKQRETLLNLITGYASRLPEDVSGVELKQVKDAGLDKIHFSYFGSTEPGKPYTYRVHGPTFVIEFLNVQADGTGNPANHIHSSWRNIKGDFGTAK